MANTDRPLGLSPAITTQGNPYNGQFTEMALLAADSTATFVGDLVKLSGTADAQGRPSIAQAAAGNASVGVVVGFLPDPNDLSLTYRKASTLRVAQVCTDREMLYEVQADGAMAITNVGNVADIVVSAGSTVSGKSGMELDSSSAGATAASLLIHSLVQREDNAFGTNAKVLVKIVEHQFDLATGV